MKQKPFSLLAGYFLSVLLSSCEAYEHYYLFNEKISEVAVTVKVSNLSDLRLDTLYFGINNHNCSPVLYQSKAVYAIVAKDTVNLKYSFILPSCKTAELFPLGFGYSPVKYIILNKADTVYPYNNLQKKQHTSIKFKKKSHQRFLLTIK